jgi:N-acetylmuramoyl-L-alanine amidase
VALDIRDLPSPNFDERGRAVDLVVLHYTGMQDAKTALARLIDPAPVAGRYPGPWQSGEAPDAPLGKVSAHWCVDEQGVAWRIVDEAERAWHAGKSSWEGDADVNSRAIGIEIVNGGHDFGLPDFPDAQIEAVIALLRDILDRWKLKPARVVAHSDVAPARKLDPGEKFPWKRLADAGVSVWPEYVAMQGAAPADATPQVQNALKTLGYAVEESGTMDEATKLALAAFQRRFRPSLIDGEPDEETQVLLASLAHKGWR